MPATMKSISYAKAREARQREARIEMKQRCAALREAMEQAREADDHAQARGYKVQLEMTQLRHVRLLAEGIVPTLPSLAYRAPEVIDGRALPVHRARQSHAQLLTSGQAAELRAAIGWRGVANG